MILIGDAAFPLNSIFEKPSQAEFDVMKFGMLTRQYFIQLRQELGVRLNEKVYYDGPKPSKWWMCFQKKKFMGISGTG